MFPIAFLIIPSSVLPIKHLKLDTNAFYFISKNLKIVPNFQSKSMSKLFLQSRFGSVRPFLLETFWFSQGFSSEVVQSKVFTMCAEIWHGECIIKLKQQNKKRISIGMLGLKHVVNIVMAQSSLLVSVLYTVCICIFSSLGFQWNNCYLNLQLWGNDLNFYLQRYTYLLFQLVV